MVQSMCCAHVTIFYYDIPRWQRLGFAQLTIQMDLTVVQSIYRSPEQLLILHCHSVGASMIVNTSRPTMIFADAETPN